MNIENQAIKLSIVIPCYNAQDYIQLAINNLERQTYTEWEAIFINDGSTDKTGTILEELLNNKKKYTVIHKKNGGTASTRNKGIEAAKGKYITFLDVDDEIDSQMYEKLVFMMEETNVDMAVCGFFFKLERKIEGQIQTVYLEEKKYPTSLYKNRNEIREYLVDMWDSDILSNVWNKIYRMDLLRSNNLEYRNGHVYTEDRVFNRQYIENCESIFLTEDCLYYYVRERAGSTTEKYREDYFNIRHKEYMEFQTHFKAMDVWNLKAKEYVCREFAERISGCIENIFHAEKLLSKRQKAKIIRKIIHHADVVDAVNGAVFRSKKMKILIYPIRARSTLLTYGMYYVIYKIRKANPGLFHKLKSRR